MNIFYKVTTNKHAMLFNRNIVATLNSKSDNSNLSIIKKICIAKNVFFGIINYLFTDYVDDSKFNNPSIATIYLGFAL